MAWTDNFSKAQILHGPYEVLLGTDGSENSLGDVRDVAFNPGLTVTEIKGGDLSGRDTTVHAIISGINPRAAFVIKQTKVADLFRAFPYLTLSTGPTKKSLSINCRTLGGKDLSSYATRIRLHILTGTDITTKDDDKIFPLAIIVPADEDNDFSGQDSDGLACLLISLPAASATAGDKAVIGVDQA